MRCPFRIGIVSTGLIFHHSDERRLLLEKKYGTVVLDEAHKARKAGGLGPKKDEPNNLLEFMLQIGKRTKHLLLGTATPIQTDVSELWDLMRILNGGVDFVFGREATALWPIVDQSLPILRGEWQPTDEKLAWEWLRNPLPPEEDDPVIASLRLQLGIRSDAFFTDKGYGSLGYSEQQNLAATLADGYFQEHNPFLRHIVLRRRQTLEAAGLLERIAVEVHPAPNGLVNYGELPFEGQGLRTNHPFDLAYQAAEAFTWWRKVRPPSAQVLAEIQSGWLANRPAPAPAVTS